ncbi:hypothetical protein [Pontibacter brevis]
MGASFQDEITPAMAVFLPVKTPSKRNSCQVLILKIKEKDQCY